MWTASLQRSLSAACHALRRGFKFLESPDFCHKIRRQVRRCGMSELELAKEAAAAATVEKKAISAPSVLNEAWAYARPSSFSRGLRLDIKGITILLISGTASIDEDGKTVHEGDRSEEHTSELQ